MSSERDVVAWQAYQVSAEKYDYFMLGLSSALTAYIGQHLSPVHPGRNAPTLEAAALAVLAGAVVAGLYQRRAAIVLAGVQARVLGFSAHVGQIRTQLATNSSGMIIDKQSGRVLSAAQATVEMEAVSTRRERSIEVREQWSRRASVAYRIRDALLAASVAAYAVAKVWGAFVIVIAPR